MDFLSFCHVVFLGGVEVGSWYMNTIFGPSSNLFDGISPPIMLSSNLAIAVLIYFAPNSLIFNILQKCHISASGHEFAAGPDFWAVRPPFGIFVKVIIKTLSSLFALLRNLTSNPSIAILSTKVSGSYECF